MILLKLERLKLPTYNIKYIISRSHFLKVTAKSNLIFRVYLFLPVILENCCNYDISFGEKYPL